MGYLQTMATTKNTKTSKNTKTINVELKSESIDTPMNFQDKIDYLNTELANIQGSYLKTVEYLLDRATKVKNVYLACLADNTNNFLRVIDASTQDVYQAQVVINTFSKHEIDTFVDNTDLSIIEHLQYIVFQINIDIQSCKWDSNSTSKLVNLTTTWAMRERISWLKWADPLLARYKLVLRQQESLKAYL